MRPTCLSSAAGLMGFFVACMIAGPAWSAEVELLLPQEGTYAPGDPIGFDLGDVPDDVALRLSLSLDGVDVTRFVQREGDTAQLVLPVPIESGERELRLVEVTPSGEIDEVGRWTATVRSAPLLSEAELTADLTGEVHHRFANEDLDLAPRRTLPLGAARVQGHAAGEDWDAQLYLPVLYRRDRQTQSAQPWDLADGWLRARRGRVRAEVGHFTPGPPSLVMEGFHRRGAQAHLDLPEVRSTVTGFSARANPISGFEEGIGLSDRQRRVSGLIVTSQPVEHELGSLTLSGTYLRGRTGSGGAGIAESFDATGSGTAWSVVADGQVAGQRLRMRGEYARSRIDPDVEALGHAERDDAFSVWVGGRPFDELLLLGAPVDFHLSASLEEVGSRFGSPANLFVQNDFRREQLGSTLSWLGLDTYANFARTRFNAEGREEDPAFRQDTFETTTRYQWDVDAEGFLARYVGAPYIEAGWNRSRLKPIATPDPTGELDSLFGSFLPVYADELQRQGSLRVGATHQLFDWSVSHTIGRIEDRTRLQPDTRSDLSSLDLGWRPDADTSISLSLQRDRFKLEDTGAATTTWIASLSMYRVLVPRRLTWQATASATQIHGTSAFAGPADGFGVGVSSKTDERSLTFYSALEWVAIESRVNRPGVTFTVDGIWERREDDVVHSNTRDTFQTFLKVRVDWPLQWKKGA